MRVSPNRSARPFEKKSKTEQLTYLNHMGGRSSYGASLKAEELSAEDMIDLCSKPITRADCEKVKRPCPHVSCKHNLYLDVTVVGNIKRNFPNIEPGDMPADGSCALDVADRGCASFGELSALMNITRQRAQQIEIEAKSKLKEELAKLLVDGDVQ